MGRLAGISGREAVAAFRRAGWDLARQKGSHAILTRAGRPNLVTARSPPSCFAAKSGGQV